MLRAHREHIEASSKSARRRRELAGTRNIGSQALAWLQHLDGLDEHHEITKQHCIDLGWLLVVEGNEQVMNSWLLEEGSHLLSSADFAKTTAMSYHGSDVHGRRARRRHDQLAGLIEGYVALSLDRTPAHAVRCLRNMIDDISHLGIRQTFYLAGAMIVLHNAIQNDKVQPIPTSLFEDHLKMTSVVSIKTPASKLIDTAHLFHPVAQSPWPLFRRMEKHMASLRDQRLLGKISQGPWTAIGARLVRIMLLLHLEGAFAESNAVRKVLQEDFAKLWHVRQRVLTRIKKDPKLKHILARYGRAAIDWQKEASLEPRSDCLDEDEATVREIDDLLAEPEPEVEEPEIEVSSKLLELRSRKRR